MRPIYQIFVDDQLIDLSPSTTIALTLQASDFASGDLLNRKASFTNQIKAPITQTNISIFEFANNTKSGSTFPYTKKSAKILANGIQILDGLVICKQVDTFFNLQFFANTKDISFSLNNKFLSDLDFGDSPITWNAAFIDSKRNSTSGWCAPVCSYGQIDTGATVELRIGTYYLPSIAYKDIVTAIFENAGYTVSGDFYDNDTTFNNMVMLYSRNTFQSTTLKMNEALPTDILQSDLIKDMLIKFNSYLRIENGNIEIVTFNSMSTNVFSSIDWTNKRVNKHKDIIQYSWSGLSQVNNFTYTEPDNLLDGIAWDVPNGFLSVNNESAPPSSNIYNSIFHPPNLVFNANPGFPANGVEHVAGLTVGVFYCCTSDVWNQSLPSSYTFDTPPKPMLAILDDPDIGATETSIKYNGVSRSDYKIARFNPSNVLTSPGRALAWRQILSGTRITSNGLLDTYYSEMQTKMSNGLISTTHEYFLTDIDINSLDLLIPIYDDGEYFLINKTPNYISGRTTRVELLKI